MQFVLNPCLSNSNRLWTRHIPLYVSPYHAIPTTDYHQAKMQFLIAVVCHSCAMKTACRYLALLVTFSLTNKEQRNLQCYKPSELITDWNAPLSYNGL